MEEEQREIEEASGHRLAVDHDMLLDQCQPRGGESAPQCCRSAVVLAVLLELIVRRTASRRLTWPSIMLCQVGQFASSKSAMNVEAPQLTALITILRSSAGDLDAAVEHVLRLRASAILFLVFPASRAGNPAGRRRRRLSGAPRAARAARGRRVSNCRCSFATKARASGVRIAANSAPERPSTAMPFVAVAPLPSPHSM